jgi:hypothetical protein
LNSAHSVILSGEERYCAAVVQKRYFTREEANEVLPAVKALAERMVAHRDALAGAQKRYAELLGHIGGNGGGLQPAEFARAQERVEQEAAGVARCVEGIHELGGMVKDLDEGLIDFLSKRDDQDILLCWRVGEGEIAHWHGLEEGFAGRKPL